MVLGRHFSFHFSVSKSVMLINGLSFASARPAPQPCVSSLAQDIRECFVHLIHVTIGSHFCIIQMSVFLWKKNDINSQKCIEYSKYRSDR